MTMLELPEQVAEALAGVYVWRLDGPVGAEALADAMGQLTAPYAPRLSWQQVIAQDHGNALALLRSALDGDSGTPSAVLYQCPAEVSLLLLRLPGVPAMPWTAHALGTALASHYGQALRKRAAPALLESVPPGSARSVDSVSAPLAGHIDECVGAVAVDLEVDPATVWLAVATGFLARFYDTDDVVVGVPAPSAENVLGVGIAAVQINVAGDPLLPELVDRVHAGLRKAYLSKTDLPLPTAFWTAPGDSRLPFHGAVLSPMALSPSSYPFDLCLAVHKGETVEVVVEHTAGSHDKQGRMVIAHRFGYVLAQWMEHPHLPLSALDLLLPSENSAPPSGDTNTPDTPSVVAQVLAAADRYPDRLALTAGDHRLSYRDLIARVTEVAEVLVRHGAVRGSRIGVRLGRGVPTVVALLAIFRIGAVYVPIAPSLPHARYRFIVEDAGVEMILGEPLSSALDTIPQELLLGPDGAPVDRAADPDGVTVRRLAAPPESDAAYVMYTSGSTGTPKGVLVGAASLATVVKETTRIFGLTAQDQFVAATTTSFDISLLELLCPLTVGACCHVADDATAQDPSLLGSYADQVSASVIQATPSVWRVLLEHMKIRLRLAISGGEALPCDLKDALLLRADEVLNCYGPTEATIWSSVWHAAPGPVRAGQPLAGNEFRLLDRWSRPRPPGSRGELWIGGPALAIGYVNRPTETSVAFRTLNLGDGPRRWYRTGDLATWHPQDGLELHGRRDTQLKIRGHRVECAEIESQILRQPGVFQAAVIDYPGSDGNRALAAFLVPSTNGSPPLDVPGIRRALAAFLPSYMVPIRYVVTSALPLLSSGKIDRVALARDVRLQATSGQQRTSAASSLEIAVAWAMSTVLNESPPPDESFFDVGGDSLTAVRVVARLRRWLGIPVRVADLHAAPSPSTLAKRLRDTLSGEPDWLTIADGEDELGVAWLCPSMDTIGDLLSQASVPGHRRPVLLALPLLKEVDDARSTVLSRLPASCLLATPGSADARDIPVLLRATDEDDLRVMHFRLPAGCPVGSPAATEELVQALTESTHRQTARR